MTHFVDDALLGHHGTDGIQMLDQLDAEVALYGGFGEQLARFFTGREGILGTIAG